MGVWLLPPWQVLLAIAAGVFFIRHKWSGAKSLLTRISPELAECSFCLGFWLGGLGWLIWPWQIWLNSPLQGVSELRAFHILSAAVIWMGCGAAASLVLDVLTEVREAR